MAQAPPPPAPSAPSPLKPLTLATAPPPPPQSHFFQTLDRSEGRRGMAPFGDGGMAPFGDGGMGGCAFGGDGGRTGRALGRGGEEDAGWGWDPLRSGSAPSTMDSALLAAEGVLGGGGGVIGGGGGGDSFFSGAGGLGARLEEVSSSAHADLIQGRQLSDINKYLPGPHYDPPSKERLKELMISMMGAAYGMAVGVASMGVTACAVTFTVGGLGAINAVAGAFSENLPVICIVENLPVICMDPELWKKKNIPVGDVRSFCLIIQRQRWLLLEASSSAWLSWL